MDTVSRGRIAVTLAAVLGLGSAASSGCEDDHVWDGRCSVNGGAYSITAGTGSGTTYAGTWGECWYHPTVEGDNALITLFDSRVTPVIDEEENTYSVSVPDGYRGIAELRIGMTPIGDHGSVPVESNPFDDWNEFNETSFDHDLAMAQTGFVDGDGLYWIVLSGGGGTLVIDDVDWPGWKETGELAFHTGDDMVFPTTSYNARIAMDADLTLVVVSGEEESGSMLNGIQEIP